MGTGGIVKNAPNSIIWAVVFCFVAILGSFTYLSATESDAAEIRAFVNTVMNIVSVILSGGAYITAGAAAKSASAVERQANGNNPTETR